MSVLRQRCWCRAGICSRKEQLGGEKSSSVVQSFSVLAPISARCECRG